MVVFFKNEELGFYFLKNFLVCLLREIREHDNVF